MRQQVAYHQTVHKNLRSFLESDEKSEEFGSFMSVWISHQRPHRTDVWLDS